MVSRPPFGYRAERKIDSSGASVGTFWSIEPTEAEIVRQIFDLHTLGQSCAQIAMFLNRLSGACHVRSTGWSSAAIRRLIANPIYRGHLVYGAHSGDQPVTYARPQLAIVTEGVIR